MSRTVQILCPGGMVSVRFLREVAGHCNHFGARGLYASPRQSLLAFFPGKEQARSFRDRWPGEARIAREAAPNIMSAGSSPEAGAGSSWLSESRYREALDELAPLQELSISLTDAGAPAHARFADELNFIASTTPRHWHVFSRGASMGERDMLPFLVPSNRLGTVAKQLGTPELKAMGDLFPPATPPAKPRDANSSFAREGFHDFGEGYAWLGIFNRHHVYSCLFLDELCYMCRRSDIARIHLSPEHSLIIKKIPGDRLREWKRFLNKHGINLRHGSAALGWRVMNPALTGFKNSIVKKLVEAETGTGDLSFVISESFEFEESNVAIQPFRRFGLGMYYNLFHRAEFDPRAGRWFPFRMKLRARELPEALMRLCETYNNRFALESGEEARASIEKRLENPSTYSAETAPGRHECPECLTQYDPRVGDPYRDVEPGTAFADLPEHYGCFVCEEPKSAFRPVNLEPQAAAAH